MGNTLKDISQIPNFNEDRRTQKLVMETVSWLGRKGGKINQYLLNKHGAEVSRVSGRFFRTLQQFEKSAMEVIQKPEIIGLYFYKARLRNPSIGYFTRVSRKKRGDSAWLWVAQKRNKIVKFWTLPDSPIKLIKNNSYYRKMFTSFFRIY